jgi:hypothetical protein
MANVAPNKRRCPKCKLVLPFDAFYRSKGEAGGLTTYCKTCCDIKQVAYRTAHPDKIIAYRRAHPQTPEYSRRSHLKNTFKMTPQQYEELLAAQGGGCATCGSTSPGRAKKHFTVDHDHSCCPGFRSCGKCVRGLLCQDCNTAIGLFKESPEVMMAAAAFISQKVEVI